MTAEQAGIPKFPNLFKPPKIGNILAPNSVKYAACSISNFNNFDGSVTEREMARMETICKTGAGIITEVPSAISRGVRAGRMNSTLSRSGNPRLQTGVLQVYKKPKPSDVSRRIFLFSSPSGTSSTFSSPKGEGFPPSPKGTLIDK